MTPIFDNTNKISMLGFAHPMENSEGIRLFDVFD
jgi:hypothetical protein